MNDEPMWAADHVVALTPGSAITIPETVNEFAIKGNHLTLVKGNQFDGRTKTDPHKHIHEFLRIYDMFKYRDTENEAVRLMMFPLSLTGEAKTCDDEDEESTPQPKTQNPKPVKETPLPKPYKPKIPYPQRLRKEKMEAQYGKFLDMIREKQLNLGVGTERMIFNIDSAMKHSYSSDDICFSIDVIDEILEEDFDALLDEGSKILHSIEGTILEEEIFTEFDKFMAMTTDENSDSEFDTEDPPFEKITINTDYKIKTSLEEPLTDLELKPLPDNLEYVFLEEAFFLSVIISSQLSKEKKTHICF
ncbi:hypothetical protein Tco_1319824 [Tanacetum coccineum]